MATPASGSDEYVSVDAVMTAINTLERVMSAEGGELLRMLLAREGILQETAGAGAPAAAPEPEPEPEPKPTRSAPVRSARAAHGAGRAGAGHRRRRHRPTLSERDMEALKKRLRGRLRAVSYQRGGQKIKELFQRWDTNGDGTLDEDEFVAAVRRLVKLSDGEMRAVLTIVDADGSGTIELDEFFAFVRTDSKARREQRYVDMDSAEMEAKMDSRPKHRFLKRTSL